jgi:hypothetical protein
MSGREDVCYDDTLRWLRVHVSGLTELNHKLVMRKSEDFRKDYIIKEELFMDNVANKYDVVAIFDDRPQVVKMWVTMGMPVYAVGNPYLNF